MQHLSSVNDLGAPLAWAKTRRVAAWLDDVRLQTDAVARRFFVVGAAWLVAGYFLAAGRCAVAVHAVVDCVAFAFDLVFHASAGCDCLWCVVHYCVFVPGAAGVVLQREDWRAAQSCLSQPLESRV